MTTYSSVDLDYQYSCELKDLRGLSKPNCGLPYEGKQKEK